MLSRKQIARGLARIRFFCYALKACTHWMQEGGERMQRPMRDMLEGVSGRMSLHMPGAQGKAPFEPIDPYRLDTTELPVTDDLYAPSGAIAEAEQLAARSAGVAHTILLHGGSTAGMHAMLLYAASRAEKVILPRNVHISALHLCAVAGVEPVFAQPSYTASGIPYTTDEAYRDALERHPDARAMLVVRPDFYGTLCWPQAAAEAAHARGMLVLCDEAHGAHFNWDSRIPNAGELGADLFIQSAHKTLPALTAGAWLHAGRKVDAELLRRRLRMVQTSSPSFLNMLSLDDARAWMDEHGAEAVSRLRAAVRRFHAQAGALGYADGQDEPGLLYDRTRLVLKAPEGGFALAEALAARGIDVEMSDERRIVCILSLMDGEERLERLLTALRQLPRRAGSAQALHMPPRGLPERALKLHEAAFAPVEAVPLRAAAGRVSAAQVGLYPPGVALLTAGERVSEALVDYLAQVSPERVFGLHPNGTMDCVKESVK